MDRTPELDNVIVGADSASCVLANRLTANPEIRALMLEAGAFIRSSPEVADPDLQYRFVPMAFRHKDLAPLPCESFQVHVGPMGLASRGQTRLRSADPAEPSIVSANLNAAVIMIADKAADMIIGREPPAPEALPVYGSKN